IPQPPPRRYPGGLDRVVVMKRRTMVGVAAAALVILAIAGGAYAYYFSGFRTAPMPLALASPQSAHARQTSNATLTPGVTVTWSAGSGSVAGYRVSEQFAGQSSTHEAVARTSEVTGGFVAQETSGGYQLSGVKIAVQLTRLQSVDQVAGFNVTQRDRI